MNTDTTKENIMRIDSHRPACQECGDTGHPEWGDVVAPAALADGQYRWLCQYHAEHGHPVAMLALPLPEDHHLTENQRGYYAQFHGTRPGGDGYRVAATAGGQR